MPRNFEAKLEALEKLVEQLERGSLSLEKSLESFEQGMRLVEACEKELKTAEQRVRILTEDGTQEGLDPSGITPARDDGEVDR